MRHHITVCICTFQRPVLLQGLLERVRQQETGGLFTFSVVVVDNDRDKSAQCVVEGFAAGELPPMVYCVEPVQNIARARNRAVQNAEGDLIAFIDDDEVPPTDWLRRLFETWRVYDADGVLGPVKPLFQHRPPGWILKGSFFERPEHPTGYVLNWTDARSGNVMVERSIITTLEPFRHEFGTAGEDVDFFRRMMEQGHVFVWCNEAPVHEIIPPSRCTRVYLVKRALLRGSNFPKHPRDRTKNLVKSVIALPCYVLALPFLGLLGQHMFLKYFIKIVDHGSRLLAFAGWPLSKSRNI